MRGCFGSIRGCHGKKKKKGRDNGWGVVARTGLDYTILINDRLCLLGRGDECHVVLKYYLVAGKGKKIRDL